MSKQAILIKAVNLEDKSRKEIGILGERAVCIWLTQSGFTIVGRNIVRKTGEIDVIARKGTTLHFVEVKSLSCREFPDERSVQDDYDPSQNLHPMKIKKVARTAEWYVAEKDWEGEWQVDGALVWLRERDALARVEHLPQIV